MRPGLPGVGGLVDAVPRHDVAADARLAHPDEDHVGIRFRYRDRADRGALDLAVGDRRPVLAGVDRLPEAAADRPEVCLSGPSLDATDRDRAATAIWTDAAPAQSVEDRIRRPAVGGLC